MATDHNFKVKNGLTVQGETLVVNHTGDLSGTQVYIKYKDSSTNLMRWGEGTSGASTYRFRIDQNFRFIGNSGSGDNIVLDSADGSIQGTSYQIGGTTVISSSRNLTNINNLTATHIHANAGTNYEGLQVSGSNSGYTSASIRNTGSGDAVLYFDASNGDLAGSDYAWIKQSNALNLVLETSGNAGNIQFNPRGTTALKLNTDQSALFSGEVQIDSGADQILTLNQATTGWNYIGFESGGTRKFYLGNDGSDGFVLGSDVANKKFSFSQISELSGVPLITNTSDISIKPAAGQDVLLFNAHNSESQLRLYNNRQDLSNVPVSSIVGYNSGQVSKIQFYRGSGGSSGYINFQVKPQNGESLTDTFQIGDNNTVNYGVNVRAGGYRVGGTTVIDSSRNLTNIANGQIENLGIGITPNSHALRVYHTDNFEGGYFQTNQGGSLIRFVDNTSTAIEMGIQSGKPVIRTSNSARLTIDGANVQINSGDLQMGTTTVIDSSRNVIAPSFRPGANNAWKIRPNSGNTQLAFEYSTSAALADTNIKAELRNDGDFIVGDRIANKIGGYSIELKKASISIGDGGGAGALNLRATGNFYIRHNGSDELTFNGSTITSTSAIDVTGNSIIRGSGSSGNAFNVDRGSDSTSALRVLNTGEVLVSSNYFYVNASQGAYIQNALRVRGSIFNDTTNADLKLDDNVRITGNLDVDGIIDNTRNNGNVAAPSTSDHTAGTRIKFYDSSATAFYAMGIESNTLWFNSDVNYKWYQDAALRMSLMGTHLVMGAAGTSGLSNNSIRANGQIDTADVTTGTFRVYDGSTFRGGWGTGQWASGDTGEVANMSLYAVNKLNFHAGNQNDPWFRIETDGTMKSHKNMATTSGNTTFNVGKSVLGNIHVVTGAGGNGAPKQGGITFMGSAEGEAQAGLYVINNNSSGTYMTLATTDSYAAGPRQALTIDNVGNVNLNRGNLQIGGTTVINSSRNLTNIGSITATGNISLDGNFVIDTDTGNQKLQINRIGTTTSHTQALRIYVDDSYAVFTSEQDETNRYGGYMFKGRHNGANLDRLTITAGNHSEVTMYANNGNGAWRWDGTNQRQGIGNTAPSYTLDVSGTINGSNLRIGTTEVIDSGRNLTNIGSISSNSSINVTPDNGAGYVASRLRLRSHNNYRGAGVYLFSEHTDSQWYAGTPYTSFAGSYIIAYQGSVTSDIDQTAQYSNAKFRIDSGGAVSIPSGGSLSVSGDITISGNGEELLFTGGNNRIKFSGYRAMEGTTDGSILYLAETYGTTSVLSNLNISAGHALTHNGTTVIANDRTIYGTGFNGTGYLYTANKALDVLTINHNATPTQYLITTNIPYTSGHHMPTVKIQGYAYGTAEPVDITVVWYIYNGNFTSYAASSSGAWAPEISLAQNSSGKVVIHLAEGHYYTKMSVSVESGLNMMNLTRDHMASWSWSDAACPTTNKVTVPYKQKLPGETELNGGKLYFGNTSYGVNAGGHNLNSVYVDTLESGSSTDPLELVYYQGPGVNIGNGATKYLNASTLGATTSTTPSGPVTTGRYTAKGLQFGATNNGYESNSAQISAGEHQGNSLNFVGMGTSASTRRMDFWVEGGAYFRGSVIATGNVTAYGSASDERLKTNIVKIENPIAKLQSVSGYTFDWNENAPEDKQGLTEYGVIAQEVEKAGLNELVFEYERPVNETGGDDTPAERWKAVHYEKFVPILIEAIKEQQEKIEKLEELVQKLISEK